MSLYDVTSETDRMRSERATVRTLGARMDADVRNPNVGWNSPELVPNSAIDQRQRAGEETTSAQDIADAITAAIADRGEIAEWLADKTYTTLAAVAAVGYQTAAQVTALANAAIDTALALGGKIYNKAYTTIQGVIDAGFQKAAQVTALANAAITAAIANGQAIYNAISTFITNAIADAGALATWLANKTYTTLTAVQTWVNGLALASAENIYEWSAQSLHGVSATDAARQLYRDNTVGTSTQAQAGPLDYMQGAIYGIRNTGTPSAKRYEPKTFTEWITSVVEGIFGAGKTAASWLADRYANIRDFIFGVGKTALQWLNDQGRATAETIYQWSIQGLHGISSGDVSDTLYKRPANPDTTAGSVAAVATDYMQGAVWGVRRSGSSGRSGYRDSFVPKTFTEWITSIVHGIFGAGKTAVTWLGERAQQVKDLVFGAGVKAAQWIADTLSSTASDVQTAVGNAANAIAEEVLGTTATIAETIMGFLTGDETSDEGDKADNSPPIVLTSSGDLNMQTQDMVKVDRIFFESNDGPSLNDNRPHITSFLTDIENSSLIYQVPTNFTHHFYVGYDEDKELLNLNRLGVLTNRDLRAEGDITGGLTLSIGRQLKVGTLNKPTENGMMWLDGNHLKVKSNGIERSLSSLAAAPPSSFQPESGRQFRVPIYEVSSTSVRTLDSTVGSQTWSAGIITTGGTINWHDHANVYFVWRDQSGGRAWIGFNFERFAINAPTGNRTGSRGTTGIGKRRIRIIAEGTNDAPAYDNLLDTIDEAYGVWGVYSETDDKDDGAVTVIARPNTAIPPAANNARIRFYRQTRDFGDVGAGENAETFAYFPKKMKMIFDRVWPFTEAQLDTALGENDGSIGLYSNIGTVRIYVKVNGYWFYRTMTEPI